MERYPWLLCVPRDHPQSSFCDLYFLKRFLIRVLSSDVRRGIRRIIRLAYSNNLQEPYDQSTCLGEINAECILMDEAIIDVMIILISVGSMKRTHAPQYAIESAEFYLETLACSVILKLPDLDKLSLSVARSRHLKSISHHN